MKRMNEAGSTLVESLAALAILALLSMITAGAVDTSQSLLKRSRQMKQQREEVLSRLERNHIPDEARERELIFSFGDEYRAILMAEEQVYGRQDTSFKVISVTEDDMVWLTMDEWMAETMYENCQVMLNEIREAGFSLEAYKSRVMSDETLYQEVTDPEGFAGADALYCDSRSIRQMFFYQFYGTGWPCISQAACDEFDIEESLMIWPDFQMDMDGIRVEICAVTADDTLLASGRKYLVFDTEHTTWMQKE